MKNLDLQHETNILLAEQIISRSKCSSKIIDWALLLMENGYYSDNLYILAGLDSPEIWLIDAYFKKVTDDFNINSNIADRELLDFYLIHLIQETIENPSYLNCIISKLAEFIYHTSYSQNSHLDFFFLYDELEELTEINREEYAMDEFKTFINELEK